MPDIFRHGSATWHGDLLKGKGTVSSESGAVTNAEATFVTRFEAPMTGTNPEEMIASAAHALCFSMAFANVLAQGGHAPEEIRTEANPYSKEGHLRV